jgi:HSP20 family protein
MIKPLSKKAEMVRGEIERLLMNLMSDAGMPRLREQRIVLNADVYETEKTLEFEVELPGMAKDDIDVHISSGAIVIEGTKSKREGPKGARHICLERDFGKFYRVVEIPRACNTGAVKAKLKNGVLHISLNKIEDRRGGRRRVEIE